MTKMISAKILFKLNKEYINTIAKILREFKHLTTDQSEDGIVDPMISLARKVIPLGILKVEDSETNSPLYVDFAKTLALMLEPETRTVIPEVESFTDWVLITVPSHNKLTCIFNVNYRSVVDRIGIVKSQEFKIVFAKKDGVKTYQVLSPCESKITHC
jgi:hypothetical protein